MVLLYINITWILWLFLTKEKSRNPIFYFKSLLPVIFPLCPVIISFNLVCVTVATSDFILTIVDYLLCARHCWGSCCYCPHSKHDLRSSITFRQLSVYCIILMKDLCSWNVFSINTLPSLSLFPHPTIINIDSFIHFFNKYSSCCYVHALFLAQRM